MSSISVRLIWFLVVGRVGVAVAVIGQKRQSARVERARRLAESRWNQLEAAGLRELKATRSARFSTLMIRAEQ